MLFYYLYVSQLVGDILCTPVNLCSLDAKSSSQQINLNRRRDNYAPHFCQELNEEKKQPNNKKAFITIGAVLTTLAIGGLIAVNKFLRPKQLAEHIEFKPAQTLKEASEFARKHLGISFYNIKDLDVANWVNEGLTHINNITKSKAKLPRIVNYTSTQLFKTDWIAGMDPFGRLFINKVPIEKYIKEFGSFSNFRPELRQIYGGSKLDEFHILFHEQGHLEHSRCAKNYGRLGSLEEFQQRRIQVSSEYEDFMANHLPTARKITENSINSPSEFVADVYAQMLIGHKLPDDVVALYKKYNGPEVF